MKEIFNFITEITNGIPPLVRTIIIFILGGISFLIYQYIKNEKFRNSILNFRKSSKKINLLEHDLFYKEKYFLSAINNIEFKNEKIKTDLFRILLKEKIKTSIELTKQFIIDTAGKNIYKNDFNKMFFDLKVNIENIINEYEKRILTSFEVYFVKKEYGIYESKKVSKQLYNLLYISFRENHNLVLNFILQTLKQNILSNGFSKEQKLYFYLNVIDFTLEVAVSECERSFNKLNGKVAIIVNKKYN